MKLDTHNYSIYCKEIWENTKDTFPNYFIAVPEKERKKREAQLENRMAQIQNHIHEFPSIPKERKQWKQKGEKFLKKFLSEENFLGVHQLEESSRQNFLNVSQLFIQKTRKFDEELSLEDIFQALRNLFIYLMFGEQRKESLSLHPAIWSYCLLYPYTDNFLDEKNRSKEEKKEFNKNLYQRLKGEPFPKGNRTEEKIDQLIFEIEKVYPRTQYPDVYESLLLIFEAQVKSLKQQGKEKLREQELYEISILKGAASVFVDDCFILGSLNLERMPFLTCFGYFLQLADDLQDIDIDLKNNHQTLLTRQIKQGYLDSFVNKIFNFLNYIFQEEKENPTVQNFIKENCISLIMNCVLEQRKYFHDSYINKIEPYSMLSIKAFEKTKMQMEKWKAESIDFMEVLDTIVFENEKKEINSI